MGIMIMNKTEIFSIVDKYTMINHCDSLNLKSIDLSNQTETSLYLPVHNKLSLEGKKTTTVQHTNACTNVPCNTLAVFFSRRETDREIQLSSTRDVTKQKRDVTQG